MEKKLINTEWIFSKKNKAIYKNEAIKDGEAIQLPHTFNQEDALSGEAIYKGITWYQKKLFLTDEDLGKELYLEIGAASLQSILYINGVEAAINKTGYSMYRIYISPYVSAGDNLVSISVSNEKDNAVYPLSGDFTFFGGIYRDVSLVKVEKQHFHLTDDSRDGIILSPKKVNEKDYSLNAEFHLKNNDAIEKKALLKALLKNKQNETVLEWEKEVDLLAETSIKVNMSKLVESPREWAGVVDPYLYTFVAELMIDDVEVDVRTVSVGFREVIVTADEGVFLNGKPMKLNGVSRHQDFGEVGNAITKGMMALDMSLITEMGANTVRLSHYQHDDYFYELCDREGLLVWTEIPFNTIPTTTDPENSNAKEQLRALIQQTRNHPSVFTYGIQNEITIAIENETIYSLVRELNQLSQELDPDRYTAQANIYSVEDSSPLNQLTDLVGYNLYYGWYYGEMEELGKRMDSFHEENPNVPIMISEFGTDANPQYQTYEPKVKDYTEAYQLLFHENVIETINSRPFLLGGTVWNMFDFSSDGRDEGGKKARNQKGLVSLDRKIKKDAFYLYKAYWSSSPFVKIAGSRFVKRHCTENEFIILSNLAEFEVYLNGVKQSRLPSQGAKTVLPALSLEAGENTLKIVGFDAEGQVYTDEAIFEKVAEEDESYVYKAIETGRHVTNWFEKFDLSSVTEKELNEECFSTYDVIGNLLRNNEAAEVVRKYFGPMFEANHFEDMRELATIESISKLRNLNIPRELLTAINSELNIITK